MQSAIGRIQLTRMHKWQQSRQRYAEKIFTACQGYSFIHVPDIPEDIQHAFYKCYVFVRPALLPAQWQRDDIMAALIQKAPLLFGQLL